MLSCMTHSWASKFGQSDVKIRGKGASPNFNLSDSDLHYHQGRQREENREKNQGEKNPFFVSCNHNEHEMSPKNANLFSLVVFPSRKL